VLCGAFGEEVEKSETVARGQGPGKVMEPIEFASTDFSSDTSGKLVAYPGAWSVADAFGKNAE
jgi:hypothetical protein